MFTKEGIIYFSGQISIRDLEGENQGTPDFRGSLQECRSDPRSTELRPLTSSLSDTSSGYKFHGRSHNSWPRQAACSQQHIANIATPAGSVLSFPERDTNLQRKNEFSRRLSCLENQFARWF